MDPLNRLRTFVRLLDDWLEVLGESMAPLLVVAFAGAITFGGLLLLESWLRSLIADLMRHP